MRRSRGSYQIRKLLYMRNGPLNQPHIATRNSVISPVLAVPSDLLTWNSIIEFWISTVVSRYYPWCIRRCILTVFHCLLGMLFAQIRCRNYQFDSDSYYCSVSSNAFRLAKLVGTLLNNLKHYFGIACRNFPSTNGKINRVILLID